jgi:iron complex outermembrane receptor protein
VVKGPASFLYGQVAPGGIVNLITKAPQEQFASTGSAGYGSYGEYRLEADVTGPASRKVFYRLAASYDHDMRYWDPYDAHSWDFSPSLLWQANERASISIKYERFHKLETPQLMQKPGYNRQAGVVPSPADPNLSGVDVPGLPDDWNGMSNADFRRSDTHALSAWLDLRADDHWNLRIGYSHQSNAIDALYTGNLGMANNTTRLQGRRVRRQIYTNLDDTFEAQVVGKYRPGPASLRLLFGAQSVNRGFENWAAQAPNDPALGTDPTGSPLPLWDLGDPSTWNRTATLPLAALTTNRVDQRTDAVDKSGYGGVTIGLFDDRLLLLAGWRLTATESRLLNNLSSQFQSRATGSMVTPQYGLLYKPAPGLSLFASYAESFVPGTSLLNNLDGTTKAPVPTTGEGYDVGLKADLPGGRLSGTLTFFDVRNQNIVNDLASTNSSGSVVIYNLQSGEQRSRGIELDATATLIDGWQVYFSYSYMDARITEFSGNDAAILAQDPSTLDAAGRSNFKTVNLFHDAHLQMSAPHLANLWTRYDLTQVALRGAYVGGGANFVYDQTLLPDGPPSSHQTYTLVNALVGYSRSCDSLRLSLELVGKNLAGERYRPSQSTRARPREFLLTMTARF